MRVWRIGVVGRWLRRADERRPILGSAFDVLAGGAPSPVDEEDEAGDDAEDEDDDGDGDELDRVSNEAHGSSKAS